MALDYDDQRTGFLIQQAKELGMIIPDDISVDVLACAVDAFVNLLQYENDLKIEELSFGNIGSDIDTLAEEISIAQKKIDRLLVPIVLGEDELQLIRAALQHDRSKTRLKIYHHSKNPQSYYASMDFGNSRGMKFFAPRKDIAFKDVILNDAKIQKQSTVV